MIVFFLIFRVCFLIDDGRWINICYTDKSRGKFTIFFLGFIIVSLIVALIKYLRRNVYRLEGVG